MTIRRHFIVLDSWRGLCAVLVAVYHFFISTINAYHSSLIDSFFLFVDFFFVLSGFVIAINYRDSIDSFHDFKVFIVRRAGRVWPAHAVAMLGFAVLMLVLITAGQSSPFTIGASPTTYDIRKYPLVLAMTNSLGLYSGGWNLPSWSISAEFVSYLVFAIIFMMPWRLVGVICASLGGLGMVLFLSHDYINMTANFGVFRCIFGFGVGVITFYLYEAIEGWTWIVFMINKSVTEPIILVLTGIFLYGSTCNLSQASWVSMFAPFVFGVVIIVFSAEAGVVSKILLLTPFVRIGRMSYSIYINHWLILVSMASVCNLFVPSYAEVPLWGGVYLMWNLPDAAMFWVAFGVFLVVVFVISDFTFRWVEEPGRLASKKWSGRISRSSAR
ncbi:acyltransferase family protein [Xanthobacter flavus]|uniref:acyltransferase family protein n=1 Tax=Xanthobacter flavus TaxID=281 RepID=UPI0037278DE6